MGGEKKQKVYLATSFVSYLTGRATTREPVASWQATSRHKLFLAVMEQQKQRAREGQVYWGYNAAGETVKGTKFMSAARKLGMKVK